MTTIKFRRDTSANWTSVNPIPAQGEPCYETDTGKLKIGNGSDSYTTLPYVSDGGGSSGDLPIATATTLGGVKIGNNLSITEDGTLSATGGSAGTTDYTQLENKPQINSVELTGNKTLNDLGIQPKGNYQPAGNYAAEVHTHTKADITDFPAIPTKTSELTNDSGFLTEAPTNMVTTDTYQTISGVKTFTAKIESTKNINMGSTANVVLNGGALLINQSADGDADPSRIFKESNCITIKNGTPNTITSSDFFAIVDRSNNKVLSVNTATGVRFTNNSGNSYILLTSNDLSNHIDTNYLTWNNETEKITIKKDAVAHLAMPSNKYINLTVGASDTSYTAPADGYFVAANDAGGNNPLFLINDVNGLASFITGGIPGYAPRIFLCCKKGDGIKFNYSRPTNSTTTLRFIYAVGTVPTNT